MIKQKSKERNEFRERSAVKRNFPLLKPILLCFPAHWSVFLRVNLVAIKTPFSDYFISSVGLSGSSLRHYQIWGVSLKPVLVIDEVFTEVNVSLPYI